MDATFSLDMFFKMMIAEEHSAQKKYEMAMQNAGTPELKKVFERFMQEEMFHAQILEGELLKLEKKGL